MCYYKVQQLFYFHNTINGLSDRSYSCLKSCGTSIITFWYISLEIGPLLEDKKNSHEQKHPEQEYLDQLNITEGQQPHPIHTGIFTCFSGEQILAKQLEGQPGIFKDN